jgi:hypothetical protein
MINCWLMLRKITNPNGVGVILAIVAIGAASLVFLSLSMQGVISQKNTARRIWNLQQFNALLNPWVSRVMNDLQVAVRYPDAVGLPAHPQKSLEGTPCATKDAPLNGIYTLDAYLWPEGQMCPIPIQPPLGQEPYYNNYPAKSKTYSYPKGLLKVDFFKNNGSTPEPIVAETDPEVTLERLGASAPQKYLYRLGVSFNVCDEPVAGRVIPADPASTKGVNWPTACAQKNLRKLSFSGVINVNSNFFQGGTTLPPKNPTAIPNQTCPSQNPSEPFDGTYEFSLSDGSDLNLTTMVTLNQTGTALTGTFDNSGADPSIIDPSTLNGTVTDRTVNPASMTVNGDCQGTLTGDLTLDPDGCLLTGTFSGTLSGSFTDPSDGSTKPCGAVSLDVQGYKQ